MMNPIRHLGLWLLFLLPLRAKIELAPIFQSGMILQRNQHVPVWGSADPGDKVTINIIANGDIKAQKKSATADSSGRWMLTLDPMPASPDNGIAFYIYLNDEVVGKIDPVLVGEVWLASGQSNMEFTIDQTCEADREIARSAEVPLLHMFTVPHKTSPDRQETLEGQWQAATLQNVGKFSAVGYFFGKKLAEELKVPIGIIHSSWSGSRIEPWWAEEGFDEMPELAPLQRYRHARLTEMTASTTSGQTTAATSGLKIGPQGDTGLYQAMIHPLAPYALRGFIWYQGESNNGDGLAYTTKMKVLIHGWRKRFKNPEAPFLYAQLAPFTYQEDLVGQLPRIWWAQQQALRIPHTGMAVTNDIATINDIHPPIKSDVGHRLALWALADTYERPRLVKSGPLYKGLTIEGQRAVIRFDHVGSGLKTRDGNAPSLFEIAAADGNFQPAAAEISPDGKSIILTGSNIANPTQVRFAWSQIAQPNLMNAEGLPAPAFHTHFPEIQTEHDSLRPPDEGPR